MQGPTCRHNSNSIVNSLELHRCLALTNSPTSSASTLVGLTSSISSASSVNDSILPGLDAEADAILRGTDFQAIQLLCRYRMYQDDSALRSAFQVKRRPILNCILLQVSAGTYSRGDVDNMTLDQTVQEILLRLVPPYHIEGPWRNRASRTALLESDAWSAAWHLNEESISCFRKVTFLDHLSYALYPEGNVDSVEYFVDWHNALFEDLFRRLQLFPDEVEKFAQIAEVSETVTLPLLPLIKQLQRLHEGSPVYWAVSQSLLLAEDHRPIEDVASQPDLGFIYRPLRELFSHRDRGLSVTLKQLSVLEARFHRLYSREKEINWTRLFDTRTRFLDSVTTTTPQDLAHSLTVSDVAVFRSLDPQSIISGGSQFQRINRRWNWLCGAAQDLVTADGLVAGESRCLASHLADVAEASS